MFDHHDLRRALLININGRLVHRDEAGISPFDSAVQGGDAVWEGLRLYGGRIFKLREHLARLRSSALALAFAEIPDDVALTGANEIWESVNLVNLRENIVPTRWRATLVLTKGSEHRMSRVLLRKS